MLLEFDEAARVVVDDRQLHEIFGDLEAVVDLVAEGAPVDGEDAVARCEAGGVGQAAGVDGGDLTSATGGRHGVAGATR